MASRADRRAGSGPRLTAAIRLGATDLYFNSWRFVPANLLWGIVAVALIVAVVVLPPALVLLPLLALPTVGLFRMAALVVRGEAVSFWDGLAAWRTYLAPTIVLGVALAGSWFVLSVNAVAGILSTSVLGWALATLAAWGLVVVWLSAWTVWPLLVDPARADRPVVERVRTAGLLLLAAPFRLIGLGVVLLVLTIASAFLIVTLVTVSMALGVLIATRFVLPAADRLDARLGRPVAWDPDAERSTPPTDVSDTHSAGAALGS